MKNPINMLYVAEAEYNSLRYMAEQHLVALDQEQTRKAAIKIQAPVLTRLRVSITAITGWYFSMIYTLHGQHFWLYRRHQESPLIAFRISKAVRTQLYALGYKP